MVADADSFEAHKVDLAIRSNKWEGEDEEEEVKVSMIFGLTNSFSGRDNNFPLIGPNLLMPHCLFLE